MTEQLKKTTDPRMAWVSLSALVVVAILFGLIALPRLSPRSKNEGHAATDFTLEVIHGGDPGNRIRLSDLLGKAVILDFWASWCVPCREQMPIVDQVLQRFQDKGLVVVGISTNDIRDDAVTFLRSSTTSYASVFDENSCVGVAYGVRALPTLVVIDRKGRVSAQRSGVLREAELEELVQKAMRE